MCFGGGGLCDWRFLWGMISLFQPKEVFQPQKVVLCFPSFFQNLQKSCHLRTPWRKLKAPDTWHKAMPMFYGVLLGHWKRWLIKSFNVGVRMQELSWIGLVNSPGAAQFKLSNGKTQRWAEKSIPETMGSVKTNCFKLRNFKPFGPEAMDV